MLDLPVACNHGETCRQSVPGEFIAVKVGITMVWSPAAEEICSEFNRTARSSNV